MAVNPRLFLIPIDMNGNEVRNLVVHNLASDPGSPSAGQLWINTTSHLLKYYDGTTVITLGAVDAEGVQDIVGAMVGGNTETGITVVYQDSDGTLDFAVTDSPLLQGQNSAFHLNRANHTGTQTVSTISDFASAVATAIAAVVDAAPTALDTLNELAAALGDDPDFAGTITTSLGALDARLDTVEAAGGPVKEYTTTIGDGSAVEYTITHNLGTRAVEVEVFRTATPYETIVCDVQRVTTNTVKLGFTTAPTTNQWTVVVTGRA